MITTVAGTGRKGHSGDGGPAVEAELDAPAGLAFGPDGNLYVADYDCNVVRRVAPDGTITTFAGIPDDDCAEPDPAVADDADALWAWYGGDGGPATEARFVGPHDVAVDPAGNVYIADSGGIQITENAAVDSHRIRRVGSDGLIVTIAGKAPSGYSGDGRQARRAKLKNHGASPSAPTEASTSPTPATSGSAASIRTASSRQLPATAKRRSPATVARQRKPGCGGQNMSPWMRRGTSSWPTTLNNRVRRIDRDGAITTFAGTGEPGYSGDGGPPTEAQLTPVSIAVAPDGTVYVADNSGRVRRITS